MSRRSGPTDYGQDVEGTLVVSVGREHRTGDTEYRLKGFFIRESKSKVEVSLGFEAQLEDYDRREGVTLSFDADDALLQVLNVFEQHALSALAREDERMTEPERVEARDLQPGDRISHHGHLTDDKIVVVEKVERNGGFLRIKVEDGQTIRCAQREKFWRHPAEGNKLERLREEAEALAEDET